MSLQESYRTIAEKLYQLLTDNRCEGKVDFLYLDINGRLHTGIGMNLEPSTPSQSTVRMHQNNAIPPAGLKKEMTGKAYTLSWSYQNKKATPLQIYEAIWKVRLLAINNKEVLTGESKPFKGKTDIILTNIGVIKNEFYDGVNMRVNVLRRCFSQFDRFPADARLAMLVHAWAMHPRMNLKGILVAGVGQSQWINYTAAIKSRYWWDPDQKKPTAARECHWKNMSEYRYKNMVEMYRKAYEVEQKIKKHVPVDLNSVYWVKLQ